MPQKAEKASLLWTLANLALVGSRVESAAGAGLACLGTVRR
jgi:hypothetical protein